MKTTLRATAVVLAVSLLVGAPASAYAAPIDDAPPLSLEAIKASAQTLVSGRASALAEVVAEAQSAEYLTDAHRTQIVATASIGSTGLQSLLATISADDTRASAAAHWAQIFTDFRVYAVVVPQSAYAAAADGLTEGALPALETSYTALKKALAASPNATPELEALLSEMRSQLDAAAREVAGVADAVLAVTPVQWNDDPAVLADERAALAAATGAAATAANNAAAILEGLQ